ncbi:c-type cytochrome [Nitratireductor sp. ZSWI3]|uniref:c-type cytochrome n=1 Tax=Nitratireductor sp. ZSWI3 TaxID=2966359 RepID=UPI00215069C4|nr:c-type cytochrome [Nitratireductor sp. ZSWI3]MCR4265071.1 c-type cytochrome [Nitratireductor sp. ZSWI3]
MLRSPLASSEHHWPVWGGGALALMIALASPPAHAQSVEGERLFRQRCAACHSIEPGRRGSGPSLAGVVGREAGTLDGARYSQAMQEVDLVWDAPTLDAFLENPRDTVPGTTMAVRIPDPEQRAAIIAFLQDASTGG